MIKNILCKVFLDICNPVTTDDQIYDHKVLICTQVVEYLYDIYALFKSFSKRNEKKFIVSSNIKLG